MNLNLVLDTSNFKPFDYSLAINAIKDYNSGYEKSQAVYDTISQALGDLATAVKGSTKAKQIYDEYQNRFNSAAEDFANGMTVRTASELGKLRLLYGTKIRQLEKANEAMVKEAERRRADKPEANMMYLDMGNLDDWLQDPNRILGKYSGTLLTNEVSAMVSAVSKDIIDKSRYGQLDPDTQLWVLRKGFSKENINNAIAEVQYGGIENVSDPVLKNILKSAMNSSGIYQWADANTRKIAENMAARGLYGGIGESSIGEYVNREYGRQRDWYYKQLEMEQSYRNAMNLQRAKLQADSDAAIGGMDKFSYLDLKDENGVTQYLKIQDILSTLVDDNGALKQEYIGTNKNPLAIYDAYVKESEQHPISYTLPSSTGGGSTTQYDYDTDTAEDIIKRKYKVSSILSKELYDALKALGYSAYGDFEWFKPETYLTWNKGLRVSTYRNGADLLNDSNERLHNLATRNTVSIAQGEAINKLLFNNLLPNIEQLLNNNSIVEIDRNGNTIDRNPNLDAIKTITDSEKGLIKFGIDLGKEMIIMKTPEGIYGIKDPSALGSGVFVDIWDNAINSLDPNFPGVKMIKNSKMSDKQKSDDIYTILRATLKNLMELTGRNIFLILPNTNNN